MRGGFSVSLELKDQYNKIHNFCYFKVKNQQIAEDLTQETFLKYFASTNYLETGKQLAYLYTIARNCCNDYFRKSTTDELTEDSIIHDNSNKLDTFLTLKAEVSKLSLESQELILLRFTNDMRISEIASFLGISRFAVNRKLKSLITLLKTTFNEEDFYE